MALTDQNQVRVRGSRVHILRSLTANAAAKRTLLERIADWLTSRFGSMLFLILNLAWFAVWIVVNAGIISGGEPFDPFPFGFLTMIVSLEAIALAIIVLMSQNQAARIAELREEVDLQVDVITELEITKLLELVVILVEKAGVDVSQDEELQYMLQPSDAEKIEEMLAKQIA
jgi:uncharacterized membrane protein